jgi:tetratricopeptide (TPR) repeat protein
MEHISNYLRDIHFNKKKGRICYSHEGIEKCLIFKDGFLLFSETNDPKERIGAILYKLGIISKEVFSNIVRYIEPMHTIGSVLVKNGFITEKNLNNALHYQIREITLNLFPLFKGKLKFQEQEDFVEEHLFSKIEIPDLIEEGIRRLKYDPSMKEFLEKKHLYPGSKEYIDRITQNEKDLLDKIDGKSSVKDLLHSTDFSPEFFWKALYLLYALGLIDDKRKKKVSVKKEKEDRVAPEDIEKKIKEVVALSEKISEMDYYQILDIPESAPQDKIKKAYFEQARKYHPDSFGEDVSSDIKEKIDDVFTHVTRAYHAVSSSGKKQVYESERETPADEKKVEMEAKAEKRFRQGKTLYNKGRYEEALVALEEAVRLKKTSGDYFLLYAMIESKVSQFKEKAEEDFKKAIKLKPFNTEAYMGLGIYYKQEALPIKAAKMFKKALSLDPGHEGAQSELGIFETPKKKKGRKKFFFFGARDKKKKETQA